MESPTIPHRVRSFSQVFGPKPVLVHYQGGDRLEYTWIDLWRGAYQVARKLLSDGFEHESAAAIISETTPQSLIAEIGVQALGGVACPADTLLEPDDVADFLDRSRASVVFVEPGCIKAVDEAVNRLNAGIPVIPLEPLVPGEGPEAPDQDPELESRMEVLGPGSTALALATRGTTEAPRLVDITHRNLLVAGQAVSNALGRGLEDVWLSLGSWNHPFLRLCGYYTALSSGGEAALVSGGAGTLEDLWLIRPTVLACMNSELPGLGDRARSEVASLGGVDGWMARQALEAGLSMGSTPKAGRARTAVRQWVRTAGLWRLREVMGGQLHYLLAGWGRPDGESKDFLEALGVSVCGSYGLTETAGLVAMERPGERIAEKVGRLLPGVRARTDETGEFWVSGINVMRTYRGVAPDKNPRLRERWLRTGDRATSDEDGLVTFHGRVEPPRTD